jgi:hypothetical protein
VPEPSAASAPPEPETARDDVLQLTSRLRRDIEAGAGERAAELSFDPLLQTGRDLTRCLARSHLEILVDGGEAIEQMAGLAKTLAAEQPDAARAILDGLGRAVGVLEQSLDAVLEDAGAERLDNLGEALLAAFPDPWSSYLDDSASDDGAAGHGETGGEPFDARLTSEHDMLQTLAAEAEDALTGCEAMVLGAEAEGFGPEVLSALDRELALIEEAAGAADLADAAAALATGRQIVAEAGEKPLGDEQLADVVLGVLDGTRAILAQSCGGAAGAWIEVDALSAGQWARLDRARDHGAADETATRPFERIFRHLRQAVRGRAAISIEPVPEELRIERAVGDRIEGALLHIVGAVPPAARGAAARIRIQAERIGDNTLVVTMDDDETPDEDGDVAAIDRHVGVAPIGSRPEALHWIDATKDLEERDLERLLYRAGFSNVVQILVSPRALTQRIAGAAP